MFSKTHETLASKIKAHALIAILALTGSVAGQNNPNSERKSERNTGSCLKGLEGLKLPTIPQKSVCSPSADAPTSDDVSTNNGKRGVSYEIDVEHYSSRKEGAPSFTYLTGILTFEPEVLKKLSLNGHQFVHALQAYVDGSPEKDSRYIQALIVTESRLSHTKVGSGTIWVGLGMYADKDVNQPRVSIESYTFHELPPFLANQKLQAYQWTRLELDPGDPKSNTYGFIEFGLQRSLANGHFQVGAYLSKDTKQLEPKISYRHGNLEITFALGQRYAHVMGIKTGKF